MMPRNDLEARMVLVAAVAFVMRTARALSNSKNQGVELLEHPITVFHHCGTSALANKACEQLRNFALHRAVL